MYPITTDSPAREFEQEGQFIAIRALNPSVTNDQKSALATTNGKNISNFFSAEASVDTIFQAEAESSISNLNYYKAFQGPSKSHLYTERKEILIQQRAVMKNKMINLHLLGGTEDAYTWKGKTIITKEVESIIKIILGLSHCLVYGVQVSQFFCTYISKHLSGFSRCLE